MQNKFKRYTPIILIISLSSLIILGFCFYYLNKDSNNTQTEISNSNNTSEVLSQTDYNEIINDHEESTDYIWDESEVKNIYFDNNSIDEDSTEIEVEESKMTILASGNYQLKGVLDDGQIYVNAQDNGIVRLILNNVEINNTEGPAIFIENAEKTIIILNDETENVLTDGSSYNINDSDEEDNDPNASIYSKDNLTIYGQGSLVVKGNYNDGITSKDGLIIRSNNITVNAKDDGIRGKDYLVIKEGNLLIISEGDGLKSNNEEDGNLGYISIEEETGTIDISTQTDGIQTEGVILINGGNITINSNDDSIHSNDQILINNGEFSIEAEDDAIHAENNLTINGGDINIDESNEGIESSSGIITINDGNIRINSSDDGLNAANGKSLTDSLLNINGGYIYLNTEGDSLDSNGDAKMTGGTVIINGTTYNNNGVLDCDNLLDISGGLLITAGSSGMAQAPDSKSTQNSVLINLESTQNSGNLYSIKTEEGEEILTFMPTKSYQSIVVSSPDLNEGETYNLYIGGTASGSETDGLYEGNSYSGGTLENSFTISDKVTTVGEVSTMGGFRKR